MMTGQASLPLADDRFPMTTSHIVKARPALHDDCEAVLVALAVVGLAGAGDTGEGSICSAVFVVCSV